MGNFFVSPKNIFCGLGGTPFRSMRVRSEEDGEVVFVEAAIFAPLR
jgi:hypothetical protein